MPAAGTFESVPQGPLDATNQSQQLAQVSSRHDWGTRLPSSDASVSAPSGPVTIGQWSAMCGVFTHQVDELVCDFGRAIYHGKELGEPPGSEGLVVVQRKLFSLLTTPWRLAYVNMVGDEKAPVGAWADEQDPETK